MDDLFKLIGIGILVALAILFAQSYSFAQDHHIGTGVVFGAAIAVFAATGLAALVAAKVGGTEGFCLWLILSWISSCPVLTAIAKVNSLRFSLYGEGNDPAWYGTWWFEWGVGFGLVALSVYLLRRKHSYW